MTRRKRITSWSKPFQRALTAITRTTLRNGVKAISRAVKTRPVAAKAKSERRPSTSAANWSVGIALGAAGARRYRLYKPSGILRTEHLPLLVMLHGCGQDAEAFAASTRMNPIATRERFLVLYPEQDRLSNAQSCWNWYDTRSGKAQREAASIDATIDQVCRLQPVDPKRIVLAGLSAGASMAALLAILRPERFRAIAMHSGVAPGSAHSLATALSAMNGHGKASNPIASLTAGVHLPALLVIQGSADRIVAPSNGDDAVRLWAACESANPTAPRYLQRGARYRTTVTEYRNQGRPVATLCEIAGLGHAWSGGAKGHAFSDPKGPDASRMIWTFATKQFARATNQSEDRLGVMQKSAETSLRYYLT